MANDNRGNYGDPAEHAKAGSMSSGNQGNSQQDEAGQKGGRADHPNGRGLENADEKTREKVAQTGGQSSSRSSDDLDEI